jgi:methionyl-tRNA formyltransferase
MEKFKVVFMGTPDFSYPILRSLHAHGLDVCLVVTQPDRPVGRKRVLTPPPVKKTALELGLEVFQPERIRDDYQYIIDKEPDLLITAAYGQMLPTALLEAPKYGSINVHASLLPKLRGGSPMHTAITEGFSETGVTIMHMVKKMDAGDIISQEVVEITDEDTVGTLHNKLSITGSRLLLETIPSIIADDYERIVQDESQVTYANKLTREDEEIKFDRPVKKVFDHIRGFNPWPGTFFKFNGKNVKVWSAIKLETEKYNDKENGEVVIIDPEFIGVKTIGGVLGLTQIQFPGKKRVLVKEYLNQNSKDKISLGNILGR